MNSFQGNMSTMENTTDYDCRLCEQEDLAYRIPGGIEMMRKHVAIVHCAGKDSYRTHRCLDCKKTFYDHDHFTKHLIRSSECQADSLQIEALSEGVEKALASLVKQVGRPVEVPAQVPISPASYSSSATPISLSVKQEHPGDVGAANNSDAIVINLCESDQEDENRKEPGQIALMPRTPNESITNAPVPSENADPMNKSNEHVSTPNLRERKSKEGSISKTQPKADAVGATHTKSPAKSTRSQQKLEISMGFQSRKSGSEKNIVKQGEIVTGPRKRRAVNYADDNTSDSEMNNETDSDEWQPSDGQPEEEHDHAPKKSLLDRCQLCIELQNNRPPIFTQSDKEAHALIHLKFAPSFSGLSNGEAKQRPEFQKVMRMCFEEGFYEVLKRQEENGMDMS